MGSAVIQVVATVSKQLAPRLTEDIRSAPVSFAEEDADELMRDLGAHAGIVLGYLESPDFAAVVAQLRFNSGMGRVVSDQLHHGLRLQGLPEQFLDRATDVLHQVLKAVCAQATGTFGKPDGTVSRDDLIAAAANNSRMLARLKSLAEFNEFAARLCGQVVALHDKIRLPHIGVSRAVPYDELYVQPTLAPLSETRLGAPAGRTVVLGDPGAGKSTLAAKLAHDIARDGSGRVPFLMVLRQFTNSFDDGGQHLLHYLEMLCREPYNIKPPRDGIEYLLRTGRAVVVLDGLDEVVQTELRRRVVALVEGFAHLHPLVPIVVTARNIGYLEAPLSTDLFATTHIEEFERDKVEEYVLHWFLLDDATSPVQRERLVTSFMEDSEQIPELRSNPLLLALLCAMYSSDRYLPRNLAQVYERCALMLFEQWDAKRGISLPLQFHGRLRGAVQYLAWQMFTAPESGKAQPRSRIVQTLTEYLHEILDDYDESVATAERFLAFCTGRAWVLTDVGATDTEPQFGFTHRTFLEYFAAERLVRTHRTAHELWNALGPKISQWEVVAQIALQLHDRNVDGGMDELLGEAVSGDCLNFASRALHYMQPSRRTIKKIVEAAVDRSVFVPTTERCTFGDQNMSVSDNALVICVNRSSAANLPTVEQVLAERLGALIGHGEPGAMLLLDHLHLLAEGDNRDRLIWIRQVLQHQWAEPLEAARTFRLACGVLAITNTGLLPAIVRKNGVTALYRRCVIHTKRSHSAARLLLHPTVPPISTQAGDLIALAMAKQRTPWISIEDFTSSDLLTLPNTARTDSLALMLQLPLLERTPSPIVAGAYELLQNGRWGRPGRNAALKWIRQSGYPPQIRRFLTLWVRGSITVRGPAQSPQPQPPAAR